MMMIVMMMILFIIFQILTDMDDWAVSSEEEEDDDDADDEDGESMISNMSCIAIKPVVRVSNNVRHTRGCTATEDCYGLKILRMQRNCTIYVAKTKALNSCMVTVQLACTFVLAYAKSRFFHETVNIEKKITFWHS